MMIFMLEEALIIVRQRGVNTAVVKCLYGVYELMDRCLKSDVNKIGVVRPLLQ